MTKSKGIEESSSANDFSKVIEEGLRRTQIVAEQKAREEKALLKDLLVMSDDLEQIEEPLLTVDQVAEQLGVSSQTVRNWESSGKLVPDHRTEGGHRRYHQKQITDVKKSHKEFELFLKIQPSQLLSTLEQVLSNFQEDENICVSIRHDGFNRKVHFTLDSEDGLCTLTKTFRMED